MRQNIIRSLALIAIGFYAFTLANDCSSFDELDYATKQYYGGDAYTGIQHAAARSSQNVSELAEIVKFGFSSLLRIIALILIVLGVTDLFPALFKKEETTEKEETAEQEETTL